MKDMSEIWRSEQACLVAGDWKITGNTIEVKAPFDGSIITKLHMATEKEVETAISACVKSFEKTRSIPAYKRAEWLMDISRQLEERAEEAALVLAAEAGKPLKDAYLEVDRAINTFRIASEEARRIEGEFIPLDSMPAGEGRFAILKRFPIGPVAAISPFNFPLNLVAHKIAPAIAAGCPIVIKPATKTPITALLLAQLVLKTDWPKEAISVVPCDRKVGDKLVTDPRFKLLTFTGSPAVGWSMKERAGARKKVVLELGGNAGVIIDKGSDIELAATRIRAGGFGFAGQSCISVQRIFVHKDEEKAFTELLVKKVKEIKVGNPLDNEIDLGPMIDEKSAKRTEEWVNEAVKDGGKVLTGGKSDGVFFEPTVMNNVKRTAKICSEEAFAPVVIIEAFDDFDKALEALNDSVFGLQAGVFTNNQSKIWKAFDKLEVGGVIINDIPTFRVDQMPYGGIKESGVGREGPKYAIEDMTELKILVLRR